MEGRRARARDVDEALWTRFRAAQDTFFTNRDTANAAQDAEFAANAEVKELLVEAEPPGPRHRPRCRQGRVPRPLRALGRRRQGTPGTDEGPGGRIRKVEQAIRSVEEERWARTDPEKSARADDMVTKLEDAIAKIEADLAAAQASGSEKAKDLAENLESRQAFLEMARRAADCLWVAGSFLGRPEKTEHGIRRTRQVQEPYAKYGLAIAREISWAYSQQALGHLGLPEERVVVDRPGLVEDQALVDREAGGVLDVPAPAGRHDQVVVDRLEHQVRRSVARHPRQGRPRGGS